MNRSILLLASFALVSGSSTGCTVIAANAVEDVIHCDGRPDGSICGNEFDDGVDRICVASACVAKACGDGYVDELASEQCDDGNDVDGDGCETTTCIYSCTLDSECDDEQVCSGTETCSLTTHACVAGTAVACTPSDACHTTSCTEESGGTCVEVLIDGDGDGFAPSSLGACGTDCDDTNAMRYPGNPEICMDGVDNNCNGNGDEAAQTTWYADCDGDGFAAVGAKSLVACTKPATDHTTTSCPLDGGNWTTLNPNTSATTDCAEGVPLAYPGATAWHTDTVPVVGGYNWNCTAGTEYRYPSGTMTCTPRKFCVASKAVCCFTATQYATWTDGTAPYCNVAESMTTCGSTGSPNPCGDPTSVTQSCR